MGQNERKWVIGNRKQFSSSLGWAAWKIKKEYHVSHPRDWRKTEGYVCDTNGKSLPEPHSWQYVDILWSVLDIFLENCPQQNKALNVQLIQTGTKWVALKIYNLTTYTDNIYQPCEKKKTHLWRSYQLCKMEETTEHLTNRDLSFSTSSTLIYKYVMKQNTVLITMFGNDSWFCCNSELHELG